MWANFQERPIYFPFIIFRLFEWPFGPSIVTGMIYSNALIFV
jgi:hypothetical protein